MLLRSFVLVVILGLLGACAGEEKKRLDPRAAGEIQDWSREACACAEASDVKKCLEQHDAHWKSFQWPDAFELDDASRNEYDALRAVGDRCRNELSRAAAAGSP